MSNAVKKIRVSGSISLIASVAVSLAAAVLYLIFGVSSGTFVGSILALTAAATAVQAVALIYKGFFADYLPIASVALMAAALMQFAGNSVDDVTAFFVGMGNYFGNADNVGFRVVIVVAMLAAIILSIVNAFAKPKQK